MDGLTVGRIVHIRVERGDRGKCQPAMVVQVWEDEPRAYVNLQVFRDGSNDSKYDGLGYDAQGNWTDAPLGASATRWDTSVYEGQKTHEFHDPRACESTPT
jgi:hypothetical protein